MIIRHRFINEVGITVKFNCQLFFRTVKIEDICSDTMLPTKLVTTQIALLQ